MFARCVGLCGVALVVATLARLEAQVPAQPINQSLLEAVVLHRKNKLPEAVARLKKAAAAEPGNQAIADYLAELTSFVQREALAPYALKAAPAQEATIKSLAEYLAKGGKTDADKAFLIFRWITDHIAYDYEAFRVKRPTNLEPADVLAKRKTVCAGYAALYEALCREAGLEVVLLSGHAKGVGFIPGVPLEDAGRHAWNAVKLDGRWALIDATWAAGHVRGNKSWVKKYDPYWFDPPPEQVAFSHFPADAKWQLVPKPMSQAAFEKLPWTTEILRLGFKPADIQRKAQDKAFRDFPSAHVLAGPRMIVHAAPLDRHLKAGTRYHFKLESVGFRAMHLSNGAKQTDFKAKGTVFEATLAPQKGALKVAAHYHGETMYWHVLEYIVE